MENYAPTLGRPEDHEGVLDEYAIACCELGGEVAGEVADSVEACAEMMNEQIETIEAALAELDLKDVVRTACCCRSGS